MKGIFLTMEGPDGSGKTTQILKLKEHLMQHGYDEVVVTREPGGTVISEAVRGILLNREYAEMDDHTEALLYAAARAQLVAQVIKPAPQAVHVPLHKAMPPYDHPSPHIPGSEESRELLH